LRVEGYTPEPSENMKLYRAAIGPDYFKSLGNPLVAGRDFSRWETVARPHEQGMPSMRGTT